MFKEEKPMLNLLTDSELIGGLNTSKKLPPTKKEF
jgi:hypothetical protein